MPESEDDDVTFRREALATDPDAGDADTGPATVGSIMSLPPTTPSGSTPFPAAIQASGSRFALGAVLGRGGMGEVRLAHDTRVDREVAVKLMRKDAARSPEAALRFLREARVQGRLDHPAVVPVHDLGVDEHGVPYFAMKRLTGTTLADVLDAITRDTVARDRWPRRLLLDRLVDVCLAVEFAHTKGVVHRDLKPSNIMLGDFGEVYVLDWGIAGTATDTPAGRLSVSGQHHLALASGETRVGTVLGTPAYMAPEQIAGDTAGPAADIYALGCILYEIVAGDPLHRQSRSLGDAFTAIEARPSRRRRDAPPELDAICERAAAVEPAARFASARALGGAVQAFLDGDRDVAARKELSRHHIEEARAALARGRGEDDRRSAMRDAGRALALDPTATEAADLVTRLMLEPPEQVPVEVQQQVTAIEISAGRTQGQIGAIAMTGYLGFIPLLVWTGIRDVAVVAAFGAVALLSALQIYAMTRKDRIPTAGIYLSAVINAVLIGLVSRIVGPFIIAPTLVLTTLMAYAMHPQFGRIGVVGAILAGGVAVPWVLELLGVIAPTYRFADGSIVLTSPSVTFSPAPVQLAFAVVLVLLVAIVAVLLRSMAHRRREVTQQIELQAWHLRQIVPTTGAR